MTDIGCTNLFAAKQNLELRSKLITNAAKTNSICAVSNDFFNDTATTEIYTLSLHDALPIYGAAQQTPIMQLSRQYSWS